MQTKPTGAADVQPPDAALAQLPQTVPECHAVIALLMERVKLLEERVNLDSNNSSKPPSSNGPGKLNRSQRRASQRKRGAQPGHKGHTRAMLDESDVDRVVDCTPEATCECGGHVELAAGPQRHQVFEVPPMRAQVDEYRLHSGRCAGCGKLHAGVLPAGVPRGQLGARALSLVGVLGTRHHLTQRKIRNLLDQLMGLSFSVGAISQAHGKLAGALKAPVAEAAASLCTADALWMDETHYPREGIANWVWAAVQPKLAVFAIYPSRARYVILDFIGEKCTHCRGHVGPIRRLRLHRLTAPSGLLGAPAARLQPHRRGAQHSQCSRTANTCANILKLWPALWTFTTHDALVPTNNAAEQALRSLVLKRKISGPTRSLRGDQFLARGYTVHETCLRQGVNLWDYMHQAVHAWIAKTVPPSLLPRMMPVAVAPTG